jgi:hypothetical protein
VEHVSRCAFAGRPGDEVIVPTLSLLSPQTFVLLNGKIS